MASRALMADMTPPDHVPTWLTAILSVATTLAGARALGPFMRWLAKRFDVAQQVRASERGGIVTQLTAELRAAREEMVALRRDLGEERELRMAVTVDNAKLTVRVELLTKAMADDKRDCHRAIAALRAEILELRKHQQESKP